MIIGVTGHKRSGKDLTYQLIKAMLPEAERRAYADKLKESAAAALGVTVKWLEANKEDKEQFLEYGTTTFVAEQQADIWYPDTEGPCLLIREYLQLYGTEAHRDIFGEDFWLQACLPYGLYDDKLIVVTDVRFDNEAYWIKDLGGEIWSLYRKQTFDNADTHPSEIPVSEHLINVKIDNSGTKDQLRLIITNELKRLGYFH